MNTKLFLWLVLAACTVQLTAQETASRHLLFFQLLESESLKNENLKNEDVKNEGQTHVCSYDSTINGVTKPIRRYTYTGKPLVEIYRLICRDIPQSKLVLSETLTNVHTKWSVKNYDLVIKTVYSPEAMKDVLRKLADTTGLYTDISEVASSMFVLKKIKESDNLKLMTNKNDRMHHATSRQGNAIIVKAITSASLSGVLEFSSSIPAWVNSFCREPFTAGVSRKALPR